MIVILRNFKKSAALIALSFILSLVTFVFLVCDLFRNHLPFLIISVVFSAAVILLGSIELYQIFKKVGRNGKEEESLSAAINLDELSGYKKSIVQYSSLIGLIENIESNEPFRDVLTYIYNSFSTYIPYSHIGVALVDNDGQTISESYAVSGSQHLNLEKRITGYRTQLSQTSLFRMTSSDLPRVINDLETYLRGREISEYNKILLDEGIRSSIAFPLVKNDMLIGIIFFSSDQKNVYQIEHLDFLKTLVNSIMFSLEKSLFIDEMVVSSTLALATLAEERDTETGEHLSRMKKYATLLAGLLKQNETYKHHIDNEFINNLERFSPLHDIGKVAISDSILLKPGKLTTEEFDIMKTHTTYGGKVLRLADENVRKQGRSVFGMGIEITEGHHERWDGTGYPFARNGENIPLSARIVAVADVLDALTSKRPYKNAIEFDVSAAMILSESGTHFDPNIIEIFQNNLGVFKEAYCSFSDNC